MRGQGRGGAVTVLAMLLVLPVALLLAGVIGLAVLVGLPAGSLSPCGLQPAGASALAAPMSPGSFRLTSEFGPRTNPVTGGSEEHRGQDFAAPAGTPILAAAPGVVVAAGPAAGFGQWIVIDHQLDGQLVSTVYGHMWPADVGVSVGEQVQAGQPIARVGSNGQSTGPHLHFEVWQGGRLTGGEPVDPMPILSEPAATPPPAPAPETLLAQPAATGQAPSAAQLMPTRPSAEQRSMPLTDEQLRNAAIIVGVGKGMGMPPRAWVVAVATALQESTLINLDYGDRDSLGLFQQRPSQGWGTPEQILDPRYSAAKFYAALTEQVVVPNPGWERGSLTRLAQIVQRSGFPEAYAKWETMAVNAVLAVHGVGPIDGGLSLRC